MSEKTALPRLMLVTDQRRARGRDLARTVLEAVRGGVRCVQVREKELGDEAYVDLVRRIRDGAGDDALIIVNGRPRIARVLHLGLHLPVGTPLPPGTVSFPVMGRSVHDEPQARAAVAEGIDYVLGGTVYATESKAGHPGDGLNALRRMVRACGDTPLFAIGGVTISRVPEVLRTGAFGVAVCGGVLSAPDPRQAAEGYLMSLAVGVPGGAVRPRG